MFPYRLSAQVNPFVYSLLVYYMTDCSSKIFLFPPTKPDLRGASQVPAYLRRNNKVFIAPFTLGIIREHGIYFINVEKCLQLLQRCLFELSSYCNNGGDVCLLTREYEAFAGIGSMFKQRLAAQF